VRILYVHQYFATPRGSTGTRSYEQARRMHAAGHQVLMLTSAAQLRPDEVPAGRGRIRRGTVGGVECVVVDVAYRQHMGSLRRVASFLAFTILACGLALRLPRFDLVYATSTPLTVGVVALAVRVLRRIPYAFEVRDLWPEVPLAMGVLRPGLASRVLVALERAIYRRASLLVAVNDDVGARMRRTAGSGVPLVVAPNACDLDLFRPDRDGSGFRRAHGLDGRVLLVHTGAMGRVNGLDAVLDAAAALAADERLCFVLIGAGSERARLERRAAEEGLENVRFLPAMPKEELADVLATADVGLMTVRPLPILELNCANKFFDYLASGLPVVLNYEGWQARVLAEGACGLAAPQGDLDAFVAAIRRLAGAPELRRAMARNARAVAESRFARTTVLAPVLAALDAIEAP